MRSSVSSMSTVECKRALARSLIGEPDQAALFNDGSQPQTVSVRLKGVRVERARQFGDVYLALALWRGMGLEWIGLKSPFWRITTPIQRARRTIPFQ
ncbi:MAG: hypothetical protein MAG794_01807 [Gammaproteobacteria bacterium]|nr:hypothetical protein [Gammaproteobacteria bacterium]